MTVALSVGIPVAAVVTVAAGSGRKKRFGRGHIENTPKSFTPSSPQYPDPYVCMFGFARHWIFSVILMFLRSGWSRKASIHLGNVFRTRGRACDCFCDGSSGSEKTTERMNGYQGSQKKKKHDNGFQKPIPRLSPIVVLVAVSEPTVAVPGGCFWVCWCFLYA